MKTFLITLALLTSICAQGQTFVKANAISDGPGLCDYVVLSSGINVPIGSVLDLVSPETMLGIDLNISFSDTLENICESNMPFVGADGQLLLNGNNGDTICYSTVIPIGWDFTISNYVAPSSPVAQDGSISIVINDSLSANLAQLDFYNSSGQLSYTTLDSLTFELNNLHDGMLDLIISTQTHIIGVRGYIGDYENSVVNGNLTVDLNVIDSDWLCNGTAELVPDPLATGVTYIWSDANYNGMSQLSGLCPGYYSVLAEDATGDNAFFEFIITDTSNVYTDPWLNVLFPMDTLNFALQSCNIDYGLPIDSISWYENHLYDVADTSYYEFTLTLIQDTNAIVFVDTFYVTVDTLVVLSCGFYCDQFKMSSFGELKVNLSRDGTQGILDVEILSNSQIKIYPNPTRGILNMEGCSKATLYDAFGREVMELNEGSNDIQLVEKGQYLIKIENSNQAVKVIIN
jgi:hypothetical protein